MAKGGRSWSLDSARALLPEVRRRTEKAVLEVEALVPQRESQPDGTPARVQLEQKIQQAVGRWIRAMEALGIEVKGAWLVDFDNGRGYYFTTRSSTDSAASIDLLADLVGSIQFVE